MHRIGFIVEQGLGHITYGKDLQQNIAGDPSILPSWGLPAWDTQGWKGKIPIYKSNWTINAGLQVRRILAGMNRPARLDALFFHTQITAVLAQDWLRKVPSIVSLDATPIQYDLLGWFYAHDSGPAWMERSNGA